MRRQTFFGFILLAILGVSSAWAEAVTGIVIGISDGDTLTLLDQHHDQHKVRLAGIDAPEKRQDFGQRAKQNLSAMAYGQQATVEGRKIDRYGRLIGKVIVGGTDVNLRQIEMGLAWHYKAYEREQMPGDRLAYAAAENAARSLRRGLWASPQPTPPWEFRRERATASPRRLAGRPATVVE
jgi:endonuclease YncB( thermonuclease family)